MTFLHFSNDSTKVFQGWMSCDVDSLPPHATGSFPRGHYIIGNRSGLDTHNIDVCVGLAPGERMTVDLDEAQPTEWSPWPMPADPFRFLGGVVVTIAGVPMTCIAIERNGASYDHHFIARLGPMVNGDLLVHWLPDQPAWCTFEIILDASNPSVLDVTAAIPDNLVLRFGDATVLVSGLPPDSPLMQPSDSFANTQSRMLAGVLAWTRHGADLALCQDIADQKVQCNGIKNLTADGNPPLPDGLDAREWTASLLPTVIRVQHSWENSPLDQTVVSGASGAQGAQAPSLGGPAMRDPSAIGPLYLAGLDGSWPMFPLEADGKQLDRHAHPGLRLNYGQVNWAISTDTLGKDRAHTIYDAHGLQGPEWEHWFDFTLLSAVRLKGTPALQWHLRAHALQFLFNFVVEEPGNWLPPNRGVGWIGFLVAGLWQNLRDRELAEAVAQRFRDLCDLLIIPKFAPNDAFWSWTEAASIGASPGHPRAMPWQCEVFACGLDLAGRVLSHAGAVALARHASSECLRRAWVFRNGRWWTRDVIDQQDTDLPYIGAYDAFGPKACDVVLRYDPTNAQAREIREQRVREATTWQSAAWLLPNEAQP